MNLWTVNRRKNFYTMGTKKNVNFGKIFLAPGGSYTRRERGFAAQAPLTGPPPACSARLPLRPRTRPLEKVSLAWSSHPPTSGPASYKSSSRCASWQYTKLAYFRHKKPSVATIFTSFEYSPPVVIFEVLDNFYCTFEATVLKSVLQLL